MNKIQVRVQVEDIGKYALEGKLEDVIKYLTELSVKHWPDSEIEIDYGDYYCNVYLYQTRLETDEEFQQRLNREETQRAWREAEDRKKYEELKKKFG
jgi:hypothetical protein